MNRRRNAEHGIKMNKTKIGMFALALLSFSANSALAKDSRADYRPPSQHFAPPRDRDDRNDRCHDDGRRCLSAPEIDPGQALGALTLLAGTVAIVRGYRRKK